MPVSQRRAEPTTAIMPRTQDQLASRAIVTGAECVGKVDNAMLHLFHRFQEERKEKDGRKLKEQITVRYKQKYN